MCPLCFFLFLLCFVLEHYMCDHVHNFCSIWPVYMLLYWRHWSAVWEVLISVCVYMQIVWANELGGPAPHMPKNGDSCCRETTSLFGLWEEIQMAEPVNCTWENTYGRETLWLCWVSKEVHTEEQSDQTYENSHRRRTQILCMCTLWEKVPKQGQPDQSH